MNKRKFLTSTAVAGLLPAASSMAASMTDTGPVLLTVTGAITRTNRGPFDAALDQMMAKHGVKFEQAFTFSAPSLRRLPSVTIKPTLEYDAKAHVLTGPLISTVLDAAGVKASQTVHVGLRAVDGYNVALSLQDARSYRRSSPRISTASPLDWAAWVPNGRFMTPTNWRPSRTSRSRSASVFAHGAFTLWMSKMLRMGSGTQETRAQVSEPIRRQHGREVNIAAGPCSKNRCIHHPQPLRAALAAPGLLGDNKDALCGQSWPLR